jgi:hypothetical protein
VRAFVAGAIVGLGSLLGAPAVPGAAPAQAAARTAVATTTHFAFYSDFDTNLNDALIAAGLARNGRKPELFRAGDETACYGALPAAPRAGWDGAVDYYAKIVSPAEWSDRRQFLIRVQLAGFDDELKDDDARQFVAIARGIREAATPAYNACRWAAQDAKNRAWIEALRPRLAADEEKIAARLEALYRKRWSGLPIPVDVVETVNWAGANSILRDAGGGHLLISNSYEDAAALEVVFHESSHLLMDRGDPVMQALQKAAGANGFRLPGDLWHVVLFFTTGEVVRGVLDGDGHPGYTPMLYGIFARGSWAEYRQPLERNWQPYVDGRRPLSEAAAALVEAVRTPADKQPADKPPAGGRPAGKQSAGERPAAARPGELAQ